MGLVGQIGHCWAGVGAIGDHGLFFRHCVFWPVPRFDQPIAMLPHQQRIIGSATYRHAKYARQYVDVGKRRRDKTQINALDYSKDGLDITHARTDSNQASAKTIPKPACCRHHGHLTNSELLAVTGIVLHRVCLHLASQRWLAWCVAKT